MISDKLTKYIACSVFALINLLFIGKYATRLSEEAGLICSVIYLIFISSIAYIFYNKKISTPKSFVIIGIIITTIISVIGLIYIPVESINVDRWEMIDVFWNAITDGKYPYLEFGRWCSPSGMPFYFILCYPFYIIGEVGIISIFALILILCIYYHRYNYKGLSFATILLITSPAIYFEIFARSTIFFNSIIFFIYFLSLKNLNPSNSKKFYLSAIICGLILSTRTIFAIPIMIFCIYSLFQRKIKFSKLLKWIATVIISFTLPILPFYLSFPNEFSQCNPFILQGNTLLPFNEIIIIVIATLVTSIRCTTFHNVCILSTISILATIIWFLFKIISVQGIDCIIYGNADFSYLIFCIPFIIYIMLHHDSFKNNYNSYACI